MPEVRQVNTRQVDERCPVCGNGWMRPTGIVAGNSFEHKCTACDYKASYSVRYPYIVQ